MTTQRLLTVCAQNICRSPYIAYRLASELGIDSRDGDWRVSDRGTDVVDGRPICVVSAAKLGPAGAEFASRHVSRKLTATDAKSAHLIVTASTVERSRIAQLHPDARSRTFTLREAIALGEVPVSEGEAAAATIPGRPVASLRTYADILNSRRGTIDLDIRPRRTLFQRSEGSSIDIPDHHQSRAGVHSRLFSEMDADVRTFVDDIDSFFALLKR